MHIGFIWTAMEKLYHEKVRICFFFFLVLASSAFAVPQIGHQFYGYAAAANAPIIAIVNGIRFETTSESDGYYGYEPLLFVGAASDDEKGGEKGDEITFYVGNTEIGKYIFEVAGVTELNFDEAFGFDGVYDSGDLDVSGDNGSEVNTHSTSQDNNSSSSSSSAQDNDSQNNNLSNNDSDDDSDDGSDSTNIDDNSAEVDVPCSYKWECTNWGTCESNGFQTRICYYSGTCIDETKDPNRPDSRQTCNYEASAEKTEYAKADCYDGIKNQGEKDIDCGGPCQSCEKTTPIISEEPRSNIMYVLLAMLLLIIIASIVFAYKYKIRKKKTVGPTNIASATSTRISSQQPTATLYQQNKGLEYMPRVPTKTTYKIPLRKQ